MRKVLAPLAEILYPSRCGLCGLLGDAPICAICSAAFEEMDLVLQEPDWRGALDGVARLYRYAGRAEQAVIRLKYSRATILARPMADRMAEFAKMLGVDDVDAIVPVPIHWTRTCQRGFNQSRLLCEAMDPGLLHPALLRRIRATRPQARLTPEERRKNLAGAFVAARMEGRSVLLVDDVITSGHTVGECAKAMKEAGAKWVAAIAFAGG